MVIAHERAGWEKVGVLAKRLGIKEDCIPPLYASAVDWASSLRKGNQVAAMN